ncbi:unnamed protein product [Paramecium octaurelia]|uniref:Uncharacterized protein n=1 Tax=Paramecium octaurelia TaxID=43137 RepID=A0A8S1XAQ8_PAROT|nr:unnamed protein product [Paramecium octaurelia]
MNPQVRYRPPLPKFDQKLIDSKNIQETTQKFVLQKSDKRRFKQVNQLIDEMLKKLTQVNFQFLQNLNHENIKVQCLGILGDELIEKPVH